MKPVPRPPAGLSQRIKADIPNYLEAESAGTRFSRAIFNMRVAAAMLLVVTAAAISVAFFRTAPAEKATSTVVFAPAPRALTDTTASAPTETVRLEMSESVPVAEVAATGGGAPPMELRRQRAAVAPAAPEVASSAAANDSSAFVREESAPVQFAEAVAPPPPPAVAAPAAAPVPPPSMERMTVTADAASADFVRQPAAAKLAARTDGSVFGISVDPDVFHQIRTTLESGGRPAASDVDIEALVNYFAGEPARRPRGVQLEVEASPAAVSAEGDHALLRFSVDTPAAPARGGAPAIASDALIEVDFNENVVAHARRVGDGEALARESVLLHGTSVTGLYAIELKPNLKSSQLVVAVSLHYTSRDDGRKRTIRREVHGADLARSWSRASRRHRLASLGAAWGETLKGTVAGFDVARRAEELATQDPSNARAKELAAAANASGGGSR